MSIHSIGAITALVSQQRRRDEAKARVLVALRQTLHGQALDAEAESALQDLADLAARKIVDDAAVVEADLIAQLQDALAGKAAGDAIARAHDVLR